MNPVTQEILQRIAAEMMPVAAQSMGVGAALGAVLGAILAVGVHVGFRALGPVESPLPPHVRADGPRGRQDAS